MRADSLESVLVRSILASGVWDDNSLPGILLDDDVDLVDNAGIGSDEMLAQNQTELLNRRELVLVRHTVHGVLASVSGNNLGVVTFSEGRVHVISFQKNLDVQLHDLMSSTLSASDLHQANTNIQTSVKYIQDLQKDCKCLTVLCREC